MTSIKVKPLPFTISLCHIVCTNWFKLCEGIGDCGFRKFGGVILAQLGFAGQGEIVVFGPKNNTISTLGVKVRSYM